MIRIRYPSAFTIAGVSIICLTGCAPQTGDSDPHDDETAHAVQAAADAKVLEISPQARKNLGLIVKPLALQTYWKTIQLPGHVVDRPGRTDRGVTSPIAGVVAAVHAFPGDIVKPGEPLFSIRPSSEYVQNSQSELFKATRDIELLSAQMERLAPLVESGAVARARVIEIEQEISRKMAASEALRQDLQIRGLNKTQIEGAERGTFVSTIDVFAPGDRNEAPDAAHPHADLDEMRLRSYTEKIYEMRELSVSLGTQVEAGAILCFLADNETLLIEGHAFKHESSSLEQAVRENWPVHVEFTETNAERWEPNEQTFRIDRLSNAIDPENRTFDFFVPLVNQFRAYKKEGKDFVVWRFRPGERVRLHVPVEEMKDVLVLPAAGVARDGPEAYVFRQNGNLFNRLPVHVLHEDRLNVVIENDGSVRPGYYVAQNGAASLNRVLKAQEGSGTPAGFHVHADGTVHGAH